MDVLAAGPDLQPCSPLWEQDQTASLRVPSRILETSHANVLTPQTPERMHQRVPSWKRCQGGVSRVVKLCTEDATV